MIEKVTRGLTWVLEAGTWKVKMADGKLRKATGPELQEMVDAEAGLGIISKSGDNGEEEVEPVVESGTVTDIRTGVTRRWFAGADGIRKLLDPDTGDEYALVKAEDIRKAELADQEADICKAILCAPTADRAKAIAEVNRWAQEGRHLTPDQQRLVRELEDVVAHDTTSTPYPKGGRK